MKFFKKPIFTGFAPNLTSRDVKTASQFLFFPWNWSSWKNGKNINLVENKLKSFFQTKYALTFDSGRSALFFAIKALGGGVGDEILVQSYTCVVVTNAIKYAGAKPIYVDINNDFNLNLEDLKNKISPKTKILIIQHTFGKPAELDKIIAIAKEHNLKIIEDCAHSLGAKYNSQLTGTFGDIGMFSFGSDKIISCVRGGALITNDDYLGSKLKENQEKLSMPANKLIAQELLHFVFFFINKPIYNLFLGKAILLLGKKLNLYGKIIYEAEKKGKAVSFYPSKLPNALASILLNQLSDLNEVIDHQIKIAELYQKNINNPIIKKPQWNPESIWLRYTILTDQPQKLHVVSKKHGVILGNWYDCPVAPADIDFSATDYVLGSCPNDEKLSQQTINLPTDRHISIKDAEKIIRIVNNHSIKN